MYGYKSTTLYLWRSGDNLKKSFLSFQGVRCRHEAQVIRLGDKCLFPLYRLLSPLCQPLINCEVWLPARAELRHGTLQAWGAEHPAGELL